MEACEDRIRQLSDVSNDNDLHFEEFRDQIALKHKLLLDSVANGHMTV